MHEAGGRLMLTPTAARRLHRSFFLSLLCEQVWFEPQSPAFSLLSNRLPGQESHFLPSTDAPDPAGA